MKPCELSGDNLVCSKVCQNGSPCVNSTCPPVVCVQESPTLSMTKIDPSLLGKVPLSYFLGTLGMPGEHYYSIVMFMSLQ